jgi:DNA polymerase (family 10)
VSTLFSLEAPSLVELPSVLEAFAALLDLAGSGYYTARAYRRAAETVRETRAPVAALVREGRVQELRGIGPGIAARLRELVDTGTIAELDELEREVRPELVGLGRLLGIGPQRMVEIGRALGVRTADELRQAAREGRLRGLPGIGPKTEERVLAGLETPERPRRRGGRSAPVGGLLLRARGRRGGGAAEGRPR